ncbi:MAG TPA: ABC transporter substrate-binding protein, partial [Oscillibacter sp.]|nr:ABC transporter substrate-binding protein [Oscillibacter sp.]
WRFSGHLANMPLYYEFRDDGVKEQPAEIKGTYLDNFRNIWDLYIT